MQATQNFSTSLLSSRPNVRSLSRCTTQELLDRSQAGDLDARHELVGRYRSVIQATASRMAANRNDADDLAAEIYIHIFNVINSCRNVQTLPGWIKRISINAFYQSCRRQRSRPVQTSLETMIELGGDGFLGADESANPATIVLDRVQKEELSERLKKALLSLPEHHRQLCYLYYSQDRSIEEIAQETGTAVGTIKSRLFRARESMHRKLADLVVA
jgi:RNA polymerase sigma-70 factor, ECF subfamily